MEHLRSTIVVIDVFYDLPPHADSEPTEESMGLSDWAKELVPGAVSALTTSNMMRNVLGSSHCPSPARRKRMTLVPAEAEYELLPSVWKVTLRLSCTYCPLEGNLKLKLSMRTSSAQLVRFSIYIIIEDTRSLYSSQGAYERPPEARLW